MVFKEKSLKTPTGLNRIIRKCATILFPVKIQLGQELMIQGEKMLNSLFRLVFYVMGSLILWSLNAYFLSTTV